MRATEFEGEVSEVFGGGLSSVVLVLGIVLLRTSPGHLYSSSLAAKMAELHIKAHFADCIIDAAHFPLSHSAACEIF
jgi:hypothetical protein